MDSSSDSDSPLKDLPLARLRNFIFAPQGRVTADDSDVQGENAVNMEETGKKRGRDSSDIADIESLKEHRTK